VNNPAPTESLFQFECLNERSMFEGRLYLALLTFSQLWPAGVPREGRPIPLESDKMIPLFRGSLSARMQEMLGGAAEGPARIADFTWRSAGSAGTSTLRYYRHLKLLLMPRGLCSRRVECCRVCRWCTHSFSLVTLWLARKGAGERGG
jgi:hypothetical protein